MKTVDKYLQKVADETEDSELRDGIKDMLEDDDLPFVTKPKSSFKDANRRMKDIEDKAKKK